MQPNQQSFNIFVVSHSVVHCTLVRERGGAQWAIFLHENFFILKVVKKIETTNWYL